MCQKSSLLFYFYYTRLEFAYCTLQRYRGAADIILFPLSWRLLVQEMAVVCFLCIGDDDVTLLRPAKLQLDNWVDTTHERKGWGTPSGRGGSENGVWVMDKCSIE